MRTAITAAIVAILLTECAAGTFVVNNQASGASDKNSGSAVSPLRTIQAAANLAQAGDTILVKAGIYREEVVPPRGGVSQDRPITYRAAPGEQVSIRGSERITTWTDQGDGVWMVELDTAFFRGYNPFARKVAGAWMHRNPGCRLGDVYCNGEAYLQKFDIKSVRATPNTWYTNPAYGFKNKTEFPKERQYPNGKIRIWANFGKLDPNKNLAEINARATAIFPKKAGLKYIVIDGFDIRHTAPQWGDIYTLEQGAVGVKYGYGWTIRNCTITNSRNIGISLGVSDEVHFPKRNEGGLLEGGSNIPPLDRIGHHLIRNNVIKRCGQTSIYGCYGAVGSIIEGNVISETNYRNEWFGSNQAAIKILFPIDVIIRNNLIIGTPKVRNGTRGIWLDWGSQNTRVTGNVVCDFSTSGEGLKLEVNFGPLIVDNNVFVRSKIMEEGDGTLLAHNLFYDCRFMFAASPKRIVPYFKPHSTTRAGKTGPTLRHERIFNNIIIGGGGFSPKGVLRRNADPSGFIVNNNVYLGGAGKFPKQDSGSIVDASAGGVEFKRDADSATISYKLPPAVFEAKYPLITSKFMGKVPLAGMFMEYPDGKPLDITSDFHGRAIDPKRIIPGPFQAIKKSGGAFKIWPPNQAKRREP
ncbi:MAG: right-handed parallel beta-helix repeat-containing protein [Phycisphaerae bacterium]|jgi:alpha-N-arabinofuranosidase|nr:right-handed parallel beta-helix repeat-containing protein [Phycisphaerae bacterium]